MSHNRTTVANKTSGITTDDLGTGSTQAYGDKFASRVSALPLNTVGNVSGENTDDRLGVTSSGCGGVAPSSEADDAIPHSWQLRQVTPTSNHSAPGKWYGTVTRMYWNKYSWSVNDSAAFGNRYDSFDGNATGIGLHETIDQFRGQNYTCITNAGNHACHIRVDYDGHFLIYGQLAPNVDTSGGVTFQWYNETQSKALGPIVKSHPSLTDDAGGTSEIWGCGSCNTHDLIVLKPTSGSYNPSDYTWTKFQLIAVLRLN